VGAARRMSLQVCAILEPFNSEAGFGAAATGDDRRPRPCPAPTWQSMLRWAAQRASP
jgi:hypothetical protein